MLSNNDSMMLFIKGSGIPEINQFILYNSLYEKVIENNKKKIQIKM